MTDEVIEEQVTPEQEEPSTPAPADDAVDTAPDGDDTPPTEESDEPSEPALDPAELQSKLKAAEKKLAKTSYEQREARRREERYLAMLEKMQQGEKQTEAPKIEDFETLDEWAEAKFQYLNTSQKPQDPKEDPTVSSKREELFYEGTEKYEDFAEVVSSEHVPITIAMRDAVFELDDAGTQAEIAYYLGKNPKEAYRISRLSPLRQAAEIGKLEDKLSNPVKPTKKPSSAPAPIKPVGGSKTPSDEIGETEDFESFLKKRNKQLGRA